MNICNDLWRILRVVFSGALIFLSAADTWAGNEQRSGQAGATELLINPRPDHQVGGV